MTMKKTNTAVNNAHYAAAKHILERGSAGLERQIAQTLDEIDTLQESHRQATDHLDKLREQKDSLTSALAVLS